MTRRAVLWLIIGALGIACAAGITWSASQLAGQHIGLVAQPLSVIRRLAPADGDHHVGKRDRTEMFAIPGKRGSAPAPGHAGPAAQSTSPVQPQTAPLTPGAPAGSGGPSASAGQSASSGGAGQRDDSGGGGSSGSSSGPDD